MPFLNPWGPGRTESIGKNVRAPSPAGQGPFLLVIVTAVGNDGRHSETRTRDLQVAVRVPNRLVYRWKVIL
jgi:hypothetical protein